MAAQLHKPFAAYVPPGARLDEASRDKKFRKIASVLADYVDLANCDVLDVGTSSGFIADRLSRVAKSVISIDITDERRAKGTFQFLRFDGAEFPLGDEAVDVAVSNHVIEHVVDQRGHLNEIHRVLRPGGVCYLATPNRFWLLEPHYRLPFLSWLPRATSERYLQVIKATTWNIYPLSYSAISNLADDLFCVENQIPRILQNPAQYQLEEFQGVQRLLKHLPASAIRKLTFVAPAFILVLIKPAAGSEAKILKI